MPDLYPEQIATMTQVLVTEAMQDLLDVFQPNYASDDYGGSGGGFNFTSPDIVNVPCQTPEPMAGGGTEYQLAGVTQDAVVYRIMIPNTYTVLPNAKVRVKARVPFPERFYDVRAVVFQPAAVTHLHCVYQIQ